MEIAIKRKKDVILVAEDNPDDREMIREAFEEAVGDGLELVFAGDGEEALKILLRRSLPNGTEEGPMPSLVILDINMPKMDGVETLKEMRATKRLSLDIPKKDGEETIKEIRAAKRLRNLPVIVLSTSSTFTDINRSYYAGVNAYLVKPPTISELADIFRGALGHWFEVTRMPPKVKGDRNGQ